MSSALIPLEKALDFLLKTVKENSEVIDVALPDALGCVLAASQRAGFDVPDFDNSAMDGYAVNTRDTVASACRLPVSQIIAAGHNGTPLQAGTAARIFTGAPIPEGTDAVVIQENTRADNDHVEIMVLPVVGENIRLKGHDIEKDSEVLQAGHRMRPQDLGMLASLGIARVKVKRRLKVAIINTGDEVIPPGQALAPGQIYDSNSFTLEGLLKGMGLDVIKKGIVDDSLENTEVALAAAAEEADCIITTGGVSVGDEDHVRQAVENLGELGLWKLAIKPGKPFSYGHIRNGDADVPFFGLPGNPVAVFVTFTMLVRPYLLKTQGCRSLAAPSVRIKVGFKIAKPASRLEFIRVRLETDDNGEQTLDAFGNQGSSIMTSLSWADGLAEIPLGQIVEKGDWLKFIPFRGLL